MFTVISRWPLTILAILLAGWTWTLPLRAEAPSPVSSLTPAAASTPARSSATVIASPSVQTPQPSASASPSKSVFDRAAIVSYLGEAITWRRDLGDLAAYVTSPDETLFATDARQIGDEVLKLAFDFARAGALVLQDHAKAATSASMLKSTTSSEATPEAQAANGVPVLETLRARQAQVQATLAQLQGHLKELQTRLSHASAKERNTLSGEIVALQAQIELAQSRLESLSAMIDFESSTVQKNTAPTTLSAQIDELERSVPQVKAATAAPVRTAKPADVTTSAGIIGRLELLLTLARKAETLNTALDRTHRLSSSATELRNDLVRILGEIDQRGLSQTSPLGSADLATLKQTKLEFETLTHRSELVSNAILPLSKQLVLLNLDAANLQRWRGNVHRQFNLALRGLLIRVGIIVALLLAIFIAAAVWRRLAFRYVQDLQRRSQLLQLRRLLVILAVILVALFGFANELGTLATVMGFAAAGIALALQNVIISLAGYFYLSGRFGIRVGDRVQISGIDGEVLEIGFFKMTLLEFAGETSGRQPTGRAVIFPNSVVFQQNSNFYRQLPGSNFTWSELRLTLAPECDYRLAEKRLDEVVNDVFARYRDVIQSEYRAMERELNLRIEMPKPQSRLQLSSSGLEIVIRYPARLSGVVKTADEITRRLVDTIKREPGLKLVASGTPALQPEPAPSAAQNSSDNEPNPAPSTNSDHQASPEANPQIADAQVVGKTKS
jgi:small-conductance mechanosensitive channel